MSNITAMDPSVLSEWVPKVDRGLPKDQQFTLLYNYLDMTKSAQIDDDQIRSIAKGRKSEYKYLVSQSDIKRLNLTVKGWNNFVYPPNHPEYAGKPVPFSTENIALIPPEIRTEYLSFITGRDRLKDEEDETLGEATPL